MSGKEGLVGEVGSVVDDFETDGKIFIEGEYWNATTDAPLKAGDKARVVEVKGLSVKVVKAD